MKKLFERHTGLKEEWTHPLRDTEALLALQSDSETKKAIENN